MSANRRHFGNVRQVPSRGRQASYWWKGNRHIADRTFRTKADAAGGSTKEVMARGGWSSPQMALRYEHATKEHGRFIAYALGRSCSQFPRSPSDSDR